MQSWVCVFVRVRVKGERGRWRRKRKKREEIIYIRININVKQVDELKERSLRVREAPIFPVRWVCTKMREGKEEGEEGENENTII